MMQPRLWLRVERHFWCSVAKSTLSIFALAKRTIAVAYVGGEADSEQSVQLVIVVLHDN